METYRNMYREDSSRHQGKESSPAVHTVCMAPCRLAVCAALAVCSKLHVHNVRNTGLTNEPDEQHRRATQRKGLMKHLKTTTWQQSACHNHRVHMLGLTKARTAQHLSTCQPHSLPHSHSILVKKEMCQPTSSATTGGTTLTAGTTTTSASRQQGQCNVMLCPLLR